MAVTLCEVASKAGVSPVVVSKVLHNKAPTVRVSDATAERVRQAARDLGYRVNVFARNFRAQQTHMIGVLHGVGFDRPLLYEGSRYFASLMDGIMAGAFDRGYSVTMCPQLLGPSPEEAMSDGRFDGLVWYSADRMGQNREMLMRCPVPLVVIHAHAGDYEDRYPSVTCDNAQGIGLAVDHLVEQGHRRIAFAYEDHMMNHETRARLEAFQTHMARHGLPCGPGDLLRGDGSSSEIDPYMAGPRVHTGLITFADQLAARYIDSARRFGVKVPDDLSIVGFDSTGFCNELRPALTSVRQPLYEMGERAIEQLVDVINGNKPDPLESIFPCGFDLRESTMPLVRT